MFLCCSYVTDCRPPLPTLNLTSGRKLMDPCMRSCFSKVIHSSYHLNTFSLPTLGAGAQLTRNKRQTIHPHIPTVHPANTSPWALYTAPDWSRAAADNVYLSAESLKATPTWSCSSWRTALYDTFPSCSPTLGLAHYHSLISWSIQQRLNNFKMYLNQQQV